MSHVRSWEALLVTWRCDDKVRTDGRPAAVIADSMICLMTLFFNPPPIFYLNQTSENRNGLGDSHVYNAAPVQSSRKVWTGVSSFSKI
jgi:hypothetical protein